MMCVANGNPAPQIRWTKYGGALPPRSSQLEDGSLLLTQLAIQDAGSYLCHASNELGKVTRKFSLEVLEAPSIMEAPQSQEVEEGEGVNLTCTTKGHPKPKVLWVFNGELVRFDGNILITEQGLSIQAAEKEHAGIFQCFGHNPEGTVQGVAMVSVVPQTITTAPGATLTRPDFVSRETGNNRRKKAQNGDDSSGSVGGREPKRGRKGHGGAPRRKHEGTEDASPSGPPKGRKGNKKRGRMVPPSMPNITKVSDESVMVTWRGSETTGLSVLFYKIQYKLVRSKGQKGNVWKTAEEDISPRVFSYEVTGLQTGRVYRFRIAAVYSNNDNKLGPTSRRFLLEKTVTTQRPPYPPTITRLHADTPTTVTLWWHYDPTPGTPLEGFFIHYRESTVAGDYTKMTVLGADKRNITVSHLKADASYDFKMQCFNMAGASQFSEVFKRSVAGTSPSTTREPEEVEAREVVPVVKNEELGLSSTHLYIILGAVLGLLLLIVVVSATVYACRNKHSDDDTRSVKYEDTALHIHREASTYSLPQTPRSKGPNGYLPHKGLTVTSGEDEKVVMESSVIENNNHSTQQVEHCFTFPARHMASEDGCVDLEVKTLSLPKAPHDTCGSGALPQGAVDPPTRDLTCHS